MRKPIIAANWKMYKNIAQTKEFCNQLKSLMVDNDAESIIFAPFTLLPTLTELLAGTQVAIGAQNFYPVEEGAYTGEISLMMLKDFAVSYVLVGHSERRVLFQEDDALIHQKILAAYDKGFSVILCCGETLEERELGKAKEKCINQIKNALQGLTEEQIAKVVIAYEPIWAIGTGKTATSEDAEDMIGAIRKFLMESFGAQIADRVRILYGGSVKPDNVGELMAQKNIDGALVGGASLEAESYNLLLRYKERM